jgi:two-component system, cell cycle response regulator
MAVPKILSVDDSKMIQSLISKGLAPFNTQLYFANNGVEGLAAAAREKPDLIILDVTMPVMDGVECLMKLKGDSSLRDIPVIMLTAEAGKDHVLRIAKIGVRDYIVKPFTEQTLIDRVARVVDLVAKGSEVVRAKSIDDPAVVLVIDEHENIVESIRKSLSSMPWKVIGTDDCGAASQMMAKEQPDIVLISLSLPNKAAFNFFQTIRSNFRSKTIPIFGMSVKTATAEQAESKNMGFSGVITKPIDLVELPERITRAMSLDTSSRYFSNNMASDLAQYIEPKTKALVEAGMERVIVDLREVDRPEIYLIKLILSLVTNCRALDIKFQIVGSSEFTSQAKAYQELANYPVFASVEEALADFDQ